MEQTPHRTFQGENGKFGIEDIHGAIAHEAEFDTFLEAQGLVFAYNAGARTFEEAVQMRGKIERDMAQDRIEEILGQWCGFRVEFSDQDFAEDHRAFVATVYNDRFGDPYFKADLYISANEQGEYPCIESGEDVYEGLDPETIFTQLFFEALDQIRTLKEALAPFAAKFDKIKPKLAKEPLTLGELAIGVASLRNAKDVLDVQAD